MVANFIDIKCLFIPLLIFSHLLTTKVYASTGGLSDKDQNNNNNDNEDEDIGWLKSCGSDRNKDHDLEILASRCINKGVWIDRSLEPGCICVHGVWAISSDLCDDDIMILNGKDGDCFYSEKKVQKVSFIGSPLDPFSSVSLTGQKLGSGRGQFIFERLRENQPFIGNQTMAIIRINPDASFYYKVQNLDVQHETLPVCIDKPKKFWTIHNPHKKEIRSSSSEEAEDQESVSIIKMTKFPLVHDQPMILEFGETKLRKFCNLQKSVSTTATQPEWTRFDLELGQGLKFKSGKKIAVADKCHTLCIEQQEKEKVKNQVDHQHHRDKRDVPQIEGYFGWSYKAHEVTSSVESLERLVTEQNVRVIKTETEFMTSLGKVKGPQLPPTETVYDLLQISRQIMGHVCQVHLVDNAILTSIGRIFRYILVERREANSYGNSGIDKVAHDRIMSSLNTCLTQAEPWKANVSFVPSNCRKHEVITPRPTPPPVPRNTTLNPDATPTTMPTTTPGTTTTTTPRTATDTLCTCQKVIEGLNVNSSHQNPCKNLTDTREWDYGKHDLIVETIWKLFQFTHHYCAQHFEKDGTDLSIFHERIERYFHADVLFRWHNPGRNAAKMWELFYFGYDLRWFAQAVDACVCGAQSLSPYTEFMSRPNTPTLRRRKKRQVKGGDHGRSKSLKEKRLQQQLEERTKKMSQKIFNAQKVPRGKWTCLDESWDQITKFHKNLSPSCTTL